MLRRFSCSFSVLGYFWRALHVAQEWPDKPIKFIVGTGSGGGPDVIARIIGTRLSERLGQSIVVDLRPGAGGLISADTVAKSIPDGNTWLLCTTMIQVIMPQIKKQLPYDPNKDFIPVSTIGTTTNVLVVGSTYR
jgi:tripartite-type tricarboxylate transporter receptor subunit TctC